MNAATEFDLGPLTWVKGEIDQALERAAGALEQFVASGGDTTQLKFCRTHVHQVHGALSMVGLDGVTEVTELLESLLEAVENGQTSADADVLDVIRMAKNAIRTYLDELLAGEPNQPLRLLPVYTALAKARGLTARPVDLFFPDLSSRPPKRVAPFTPLPAEELQRILKAERARYQKGLLTWLTKPAESEKGRQAMQEALANIEATQNGQVARSFWWAAQAFVEALKAPAIGGDASVRQVSAHIDLQIRRLLEGSGSLAERLMRETLYHVAQAPAGLGGMIDQVQSTFALPGLIPASATAPAGPQPQDSALRRLRELLGGAEDQWGRICASGSTAGLSAFAEQARAVAALTADIGQTDLKRLGQGLAAVAKWLTDDVSRFGDVAAMEVATAILLLQNAQESFKRLGTDFAQQVDLMVARLHACVSGKPVADDALPALDEMTRRAQEKLLVGQVAREIQSNLAQIEQALDAFFRDPSSEHDLSALDRPLKQISGALAMLGHMDAVASLNACAGQIRKLAQADTAHAPEEFEGLAQQLSELGFFVDALPNGETDFAAFVARIHDRGGAAEPDEESVSVAASVESELARQARDTHALVEALKEAPEDQRLHREIKQNLQAIQQDADLVADHALGKSAKAALEALNTGELGKDKVDAALAALKPQQSALPQPSVETLQLAEATHEAIDAELLSIFLEEAREVLDAMGEQKAILAGEPHNVEALTTIRRNTHTLKGSGRMVGLIELGETAWELEQTLNLWLRQDQAVTPDLMRMIDQEHALFSAWVDHLENGVGNAPDATALKALAARLRGVEADDEGLPAPAPVVAPVKAPVVEIPAEPVAQAPAPLELETPRHEAPKQEAPKQDFALDFVLEEPLLAEPEPEPPKQEAIEPLELADPRMTAETAFEPEAELEPMGEPETIELAVVQDDFSSSAIDAAAMPDSMDLPEAAPFEAFEELAAIEVAEMPSGESEAGGILEHVADEPLSVDRQATETQQPAAASPTLYDIFRDEARGHLQTLLDSYARLEAHPVAPTTFEMTRAAHTLGGIAGTVGLMPLHHLAIALEHALLRRDGSAQPDSIEGLETVRQTIMMLDAMFVGLARQEAPTEQPQLIHALSGIYPTFIAKETMADAVEVQAPVSPDQAAEEEAFGTAVDVGISPAEDEGAEAFEADGGALALLNDEFDEQLLPIFLEEATDLTRGLTEQLRIWRDNPADGAAAHAIARLLHTFKGSARMAGAMNLGEATHLLEARLEEAVRAGAVTTETIEEIESGCDLLDQAVERLRSGPPEAPAPAVVNAAGPGSDTAVQGDAVPAVQGASPEQVEGEADSAGQRAVLRVRADLIDRLVNDAGELSIARTRIEGEMRSLKGSLLELTENVIRLRRQLRDIEIQAETQIQAKVANVPTGEAEFDPLELDRFTRFQELTRFMAESVNDVATVQQNLLKGLDDANAAILAQARLNRALQQELMSVRMLPFASQAERLYRIVRQAAKETGKRANLDIVGGQVEIDRSVLDKMLAPIEHMLRNAVTHGLEGREQRVAAGKSEVGEISLKVVQEGNEIILSLSDDGKGLDGGRIRQRAEAMGLLAPGQAIDDAALYGFIFQAGFSTAAELTQLAGRGVGMDVVKTEVSALGGRIETVSEAGKGTTFRLYLPLTLAVTQTLLVRVGMQTYAIPSTMIEQVMEVKEKALAGIREQQIAEWQGHRYPFHFLPHLLGDAEAVPETHRQYWVLLLRSGMQRVALLVDELKGNQEVVVKNIGAQLARVVGIAGATVLGDGNVVLILNPVALATRTNAVAVVAETQTVAEPVAPSRDTPPTVMVVDDSLTVRKITTRLLTREGYQVIPAKDGVDALEQLVEVMPDIVLCDIEMPRMDGFDLIRHIRADERLRRLPMIMITSRTADKHRNLALELGANHYLGKPYDETELLDLIAGYTGPRH